MQFITTIVSENSKMNAVAKSGATAQSTGKMRFNSRSECATRETALRREGYGGAAEELHPRVHTAII
jgi:hypothetical protein